MDEVYMWKQIVCMHLHTYIHIHTYIHAHTYMGDMYAYNLLSHAYRDMYAYNLRSHAYIAYKANYMHTYFP